MAHDSRRVLLDHVHSEARPVLARLEMLQHGGTTNLGGTRGSPNADSTIPQGETHPPHEHYRHELNRATTPEAAAAVLQDARDELRLSTRRSMTVVHEESLSELKARIVEEGAGWLVKDVARSMRCTERLVRVARCEHNRHPDTGHHLPPEGMDVWAWARELKRQELSLRQIGAITGLARSTLHDKLQ